MIKLKIIISHLLDMKKFWHKVYNYLKLQCVYMEKRELAKKA